MSEKSSPAWVGNMEPGIIYTLVNCADCQCTESTPDDIAPTIYLKQIGWVNITGKWNCKKCAQKRIETINENRQETIQIGEKTYTAKHGGYIELKIINNCGPYAYERYRDGKKLKSVYLGK